MQMANRCALVADAAEENADTKQSKYNAKTSWAPVVYRPTMHRMNNKIFFCTHVMQNGIENLQKILARSNNDMHFVCVWRRFCVGKKKSENFQVKYGLVINQPIPFNENVSNMLAGRRNAMQSTFGHARIYGIVGA